MKKSDELKQDLTAKKAEIEKLREFGRISEAKNALKELRTIRDELDVALETERADFDNFLAHAKRIENGKDSYHEKFFAAVRHKFKGEYANALRESSLPDGGYLVPTEFHKEILVPLEEENVLRKMGRTITTESTHMFPIVASRPTATWVGEGENIDFTSETFTQNSLAAYKLAVAVRVSNELLADSKYDIQSHLAREFALAFGRAEENAFLNGAAAEIGEVQKNPVGILPTIANAASSTIETVDTSISFNDLLNLEFALPRPYRRNACWLVSESLLAQLRAIKDNTGNYILQPRITESEVDRLFGQPIYTSPFMPSFASGEIVALYGDFKDYFIIGERGQRLFKPLRELYALSDETAFLMLERIDAKLIDLSAVKALRLR